jgi:hypothetical protein
MLNGDVGSRYTPATKSPGRVQAKIFIQLLFFIPVMPPDLNGLGFGVSLCDYRLQHIWTVILHPARASVFSRTALLWILAYR